MKRTLSARGDSWVGYFRYTGWIAAVMLAMTLVVRTIRGQYGWMFTWQLICVGFVTLVFFCATLFSVSSAFDAIKCRIALFISEHWPDFRRFMRWPIRFGITFRENSHWRTLVTLKTPSFLAADCITWIGAGILIIAGIVVQLLAHRFLFFGAIALAEAYLIITISREKRAAEIAPIVLLAFTTWGLAGGLTYTHLADWLLNGTRFSSFGLVSFVLAFVLVIVELLDQSNHHESGRLLQRGVFVVTLLIFAAYALRTDNLLVNWVPIHRSYFADISQFVRDGHWLLWDVPSLYGFLSMLTLAVLPAANGWQALYELTAVFLFIEGAMAFIVLRWGRSGWTSQIFAGLFVLGTIFADNLARYAWSARLYPQGGLRFLWPAALIFIAFLHYVWRDNKRAVKILRAVGYGIWLVAALWSIEDMFWASAVWGGFTITDAFCSATHGRARNVLVTLALRLGAFAALLICTFAVIEIIYKVILGAGPDWVAFVQFTSLFTSGTIKSIIWVQPYGAGWIILLVLGAVGTVGLAVVSQRRWNALPMVTAAWLGCWTVASYYALEPLDMYVSLMMSVLVLVCAVVIYVSREIVPNSGSARFARLSIAPLAVIAIAFAIGDGQQFSQMRLPFSPGWNFDVTQEMPTVHGELAELLKQAGVRAGDPVLFPTGPYWTELDQGLILPFARRSDGKVVEYKSWLPVSPAPATLLMNALPPKRRQTYIDRFLSVSRTGGWYVNYRAPAECEKLSKVLVSTKPYATANFSISYCAIRQRLAATTLRRSAY